jgi:hypothetical protein
LKPGVAVLPRLRDREMPVPARFPMLEIGEIMDEELSPDTLRNAARYLEEAPLEALAGYAELSFPPVTGDLYSFPRSSPELRAAVRGFEHLREELNKAVAVLYALANVRERGLPVPAGLDVLALPYIDAYERSLRAGDADGNAGLDVQSQPAE